MQDASKLNWALKSFPKEDFRGFWICYSTKKLLSNDTKISFLQIFPGLILFLPDYMYIMWTYIALLRMYGNKNYIDSVTNCGVVPASCDHVT